MLCIVWCTFAAAEQDEKAAWGYDTETFQWLCAAQSSHSVDGRQACDSSDDLVTNLVVKAAKTRMGAKQARLRTGKDTISMLEEATGTESRSEPVSDCSGAELVAEWDAAEADTSYTCSCDTAIANIATFNAGFSDGVDHTENNEECQAAVDSLIAGWIADASAQVWDAATRHHEATCEGGSCTSSESVKEQHQEHTGRVLLEKTENTEAEHISGIREVPIQFSTAQAPSKSIRGVGEMHKDGVPINVIRKMCACTSQMGVDGNGDPCVARATCAVGSDFEDGIQDWLSAMPGNRVGWVRQQERRATQTCTTTESVGFSCS